MTPRLVHLNGPPGIGKSTVAQRYVEGRPGTLNLDIDRLRSFVGGWREHFGDTGEIVRPLALGMARTHLLGGRDVILPQFLGRTSEIERFAEVAGTSGADFVEVMLTDSRENCVARFDRRGEQDSDEWHHLVRGLVADNGGTALLEAMYGQLTDVLRARPWVSIVVSAEGEIDNAHRALARLLAPSANPTG